MTAARPKHPKPDANQPQMVADLRRLGFYVIITADLGGKCLDLFICGWKAAAASWQWLHIEVKPPGKRDDLTEGERAFFDECPHCPAIVAETVGDVVGWFIAGVEAVTEPPPTSS